MGFALSLIILSLSLSLFTAITPIRLNLALGSEMLTHASTMHAYMKETSLPRNSPIYPAHAHTNASMTSSATVSVWL